MGTAEHCLHITGYYALLRNLFLETCFSTTNLFYFFSDDRLPDTKLRTERERKQIQVEVSRAQKWAEMINEEKKYFGTKVGMQKSATSPTILSTYIIRPYT